MGRNNRKDEEKTSRRGRLRCQRRASHPTAGCASGLLKQPQQHCHRQRRHCKTTIGAIMTSACGTGSPSNPATTALKLGFVTEELFDRVVDPAKMVRPYVAVSE